MQKINWTKILIMSMTPWSGDVSPDYNIEPGTVGKNMLNINV